MATTSTTWTAWDTTNAWENLVDAGVTANITYSRDATDVAAKFVCTTKNANVTEAANKSGTGDTWASIFGIPTSAVVTQAQVTAWTKKLVDNTLLATQTFAIRLIADDTTTIHSGGDLISVSLGTTIDGSYVSQSAGTAQAIDSAYQAATTNVRLRLIQNFITGGGSAASVDQRYDDVVVTITFYVPVVANETTTKIGLTDNIDVEDLTPAAPVEKDVNETTTRVTIADPVVMAFDNQTDATEATTRVTIADPVGFDHSVQVVATESALAVGLTENFDTVETLQLGANESTTTIGLVEALDHSVQTDITDALALGLTEALDHSVQAVVTEALAVGLSEDSTVSVTGEIADALALGLSEVCSVEDVTPAAAGGTAAGSLIYLPKRAAVGGWKPPEGTVRINWSHPLARKLGACFLFNEGGGGPRDLISNNRAQFVNGAKWSHSEKGRGVYCDAVSDQYLQMADPGGRLSVAAGTTYTTMMLLRLDTWDAYGGLYTVRASASGQSNSYSCQQNETTNQLVIYHDDTNGAYLANTTRSKLEGRMHQLVIRYKGGASHLVDSFIDGTIVDSDVAVNPTGVAPAARGADADVLLGSARVEGANVASMECALFLQWNRTLTAAEITALYADPYAFLEEVPARRTFGAASSAAGGPIHIPRLVTRNQKPAFGTVEVDWSHPLAAGLGHVYLLNEGAGQLNSIGRYRETLTLDADGAEVTWKRGDRPGGSVLSANGTGTFGASGYKTDGRYLGPMSIVVSANIRRAGVTPNALVSKVLNNGAQYGPFDFRTDELSPAKLSFVVADGSTYRWFKDGRDVPINAWTTYGVTHGSTLCSVAPEFYINGAGGTGTTYAGTASNAKDDGSGTKLYIAARDDGSSIMLLGEISHVYLWERALTKQDMAWLHAEPYAFLRPTLARRYFAVTGTVAAPEAGATVVTATDALALGLTEVHAGSVTFEIAESLGVGLTEAIDISVTAGATESLVVGLSEDPAGSVTFEIADTLAALFDENIASGAEFDEAIFVTGTLDLTEPLVVGLAEVVDAADITAAGGSPIYLPRRAAPIKQKPRPGDVEINWSHPLTRNLVMAFLLNTPGAQTELVRRRLWTPTGTPTLSTSKEGPVLYYPGASYHSVPAIPEGLFQRHSIAVRFAATASAARGLFSSINVTPGYNGVNVVYQRNTAGKVGYIYGNTAYAEGTSADYNDGTFHTWGVTFANPTATHYHDGAPDGTSTHNDPGMPVWTGVSYIGTDPFYANPFIGSIEYVYAWQRTLTRDEMAWVYAEPYALFRETLARRYFAVTGTAAAAPTEVDANETQFHVGLTEAIDISVTAGATESLAVGLAEAIDISVTAGATDALRVGLAEDHAGSVTLEIAEALKVGLADVNDVSVVGGDLITVDVTESLAVGLAEVHAGSVTFEIAESLRAGLSEAADLLVTTEVADSLAVGVGGVHDLRVLLAATDALALGLAEVHAGSVTFEIAEALKVGLADVIDASIVGGDFITIDATESLAVGLAEAHAGSVTFEPQDQLSAGLTDIGAMSVTFEVAELLRAGLSETGSVVVAIDASDAMRVRVVEVHDLLVALALTDSLRAAIALSEDFSTQAEVQDEIRAGVTQVAAVLVTFEPQEGLRVGLGEVAAFVLTLDVADSLRVALTEALAFTQFREVTDSLAVGVVADAAVLGTLEATDALRVGLAEAFDHSVQAVVTEALKAGLADVIVAVNTTGAGLGDVIMAVLEVLARRRAAEPIGTVRVLSSLGRRSLERL